MATIKPVWTKNVSLRAAATLAAGATSNHTIDLDTLGADRADPLVDITIGSSSGVTVNILRTTTDTSPSQAYEVAANDKRVIVLSGAERVVQLVNEDGSNATGNITITYDWRQWDST